MLAVSLRNRFVIGHLLAFCFAIVPAHALLLQQSQRPEELKIDDAIGSASSYMELVSQPGGRFVYGTNIRSGQQSASYNILRHAGAIYALVMLQRSRPDQQHLDTVIRAAAFLRQNYIGPGVRPNQLVVWSKPLPQKSATTLGATGLGLIALTTVEGVKPNSTPLLQLQQLGNFLVFLQRADGSFANRFSAESGPSDEFESLYYPGEAALGLIDLYEIDHSTVWLTAAAKALSYLAKSRAALTDVPADHWALLATAKLLTYYPESASPASRQELIQHAIQICKALMKNQERTSPILPSTAPSIRQGERRPQQPGSRDCWPPSNPTRRQSADPDQRHR